MLKKLTLTLTCAILLASCGEDQIRGKDLNVIDSAEIYQAGANKDAGWAYLGFVPRVSSPENMKIIGSKKGFTLRVHAQFSRDEISHYARYIQNKAKEMEAVRNGEAEMSWGRGIITTPFDIYEKGAYANFQNEVATNFANVRDGDFRRNLELLKKYFPDNVFYDEDAEIVNLQLVYAITTGKAELENYNWLQVDPRQGEYHIQTFEERRAHYSKEPNAYVFGGFPAFWFSGNIGIHGPIRYTTYKNLMSGEYAENLPEGKVVSKRWQLVRKPDSHNCFRMENHMEIRHLMPAYFTKNMTQPELSKIDIHVIEDYDRTDLNGDGVLETIGVKYYWENPNTPPNEMKWKSKYYRDGIPENLVEFEYRDPNIVQIRSRSNNLDATMTHLNRLPRQK